MSTPPRDYLRELFSLEGRTALVTGGSSGIGQGIATALGRAGAVVHVVARDRSRLGEAVAGLAHWGIEAYGHSHDLADAEQLDALCESAALRESDILVNCAGINLRPPMAELTSDDYAQTMAINLTAPYRLGQVAGPAMVERRWGRIINIGSQQSWSAFGNSGAYGISKAAICGLSRSQAEAWSADGVTANTLVPGFVVTPMTLPTIAEEGREQTLAARAMVGRNGVPADFAGAAVYLASEASGFVTGQAIAVDGGFSVY